MRLAFVDLLFSWPPTGGADVDLYSTVPALAALGHEVHVFVAGRGDSWDWGNVDTAQLPFPATRLEFTTRTLNRHTLPERFRAAVDAWRPDAVFLCSGFYLKPYVAAALAHYPTVGRYYAYEAVCIRDLLQYKDGAPCPLSYLRTPDACRRCALSHLKGQIKQWRFLTWTHEFLAARAFMPGYHAVLEQSLRQMKAIIVSNELMKSQLDGVNPNVLIFPGGVHVAEFECVPPPEKGPADRKIILMTGRGEDPMKGLATLLDAGALLAKERSDFEIWATHSDRTLNNDWFRAIGWHDPKGLKTYYARADICVVPSVWEEPFGLVAVEAMAAGRPVCASRVGGLQGIVRHGETGYLFARGDSAALAGGLRELLDNSELRRRMGAAGRRVAEAEYDWRQVVEKHYPPLLESLKKL